MADSYHLKVLGFPELRRPDGRPVKLKVRKHLALLIYFVLDAREVYSRDELVELLWPEVPEVNGRHSLSMGFSVLRAIFGVDAVRGNHAEVRFSAQNLTLDLDPLERGEILGSETAEPLEVDGFLMGFDIPDAPAFQHWRDRRSAQLLPMLQAGLLMLTDQARRTGDMTRVMALAARLLALDPLAEEGIRAQMEAFAMQGDRISALRVFEDWKRELKEQLGALPSEPLEGMAMRLRRRGLDPASPAAAIPAERFGERPFVGRAAEYRTLFEAWEYTTQLSTRHILLSGETGIGKSTLALRFAAAAALEGAAVARVQCFELEQRIAFGTIGALVTSLLDRPGVIATAPERLAEIARIVPKVRERFPHLPPPLPTEGEAARLHFAEGTFALFDAIMEDQPLVLIVDDYPRSDEASLSVLHMLLRRATNHRLMVVLSERPPEGGEPAQATRIREGISYLPLQRLELGPIGEDEGDELLGALLAGAGKQPGFPERRAILRTAGGNPMALELLTRDWITHGDAALAVSLPAMSTDPPRSALEAIGYDRLIDRMVPALAPKTRVALYLAAILGPRLNDLDCFTILDFTPAQTMAALSEMVEQRVLRNTEKGLEFINELLRARLYLKIPSAARVRLHQGVADRLLGAISRGEAVPGLEIAWHCMRAKRRDEATPFLMAGARGAITHGAPDEAARALTSALGHLKGRAKAEATLLLAETYQEMAEWKEALRCLESLDRSSTKDAHINELANILQIESQQQLETYSDTEMPLIVQELASIALSDRAVIVRVKAAQSAVFIASRLRQPDLFAVVRDVLSGFSLEGLSPHDTSRILLSRAMAHYHVREKSCGWNEVVTASQLLERLKATDSTFVQIQTGMGAISSAEGRYEEGVRYTEIAYNAARRLDNFQLMAQAAGNLGLSYYRLGRRKEHLQWATTALDHAKRLPPGSYARVLATALCCFANIAAGETARATNECALVRKAGNEAKLGWIQHVASLFAADVNWLLGNRVRAFAIFKDVETSLSRDLSIGFVGRFLRWKTLSSIRSGKTEETSALLHKWYRRIDELDGIDRAELLCSLIQLQDYHGKSNPEVLRQARAVLGYLPSACSTQLKQLGLTLPA